MCVLYCPPPPPTARPRPRQGPHRPSHVLQGAPGAQSVHSTQWHGREESSALLQKSGQPVGQLVCCDLLVKTTRHSKQKLHLHPEHLM